MSNAKSVFITGATSGVGYLLTKRLLPSFETVQITGRNRQVLEELEREGAHAYCADLRRTDELDWLCEQIEAPDVVIISAGVGTFEFASELQDDQIEEMVDVNVTVPMQLTKRLLPEMMARASGHLVFIGSQAGKVASPKASVYAATKHALIGYTNALRMEVQPYGIDVSVIHPGPIDTPFIDHADATGEYKKSLGNYLLTTEEVVEAIIQTIEKPARDVNIPRIMGITSKLYAVAPTVVERVGRKFFYKK